MSTTSERKQYIVVLERKNSESKIRLIGYGQTEQECLGDAMVKTITRYPMTTVDDWDFIFWEEVEEW